MGSMNRRLFLQATAGLGTGIAVGFKFAAAAEPGLRVRRSALQLPSDHQVFKDYADAVKAMHDEKPESPLHWINQAKIHADFCHDWTENAENFLPWHRHYVNQFEKICGAVIGKSDFALPYWDWTYLEGKIPDAFFDLPSLDVVRLADSGHYASHSPTWRTINTIPGRAIGKGFGLQKDPTQGGSFLETTIGSILTESRFQDFSIRLEGEPHNAGHVVVGFPANNNKRYHIGSGLSPLDPLFWLHHCNVDRLWAQWQMAGNQQSDYDAAYKKHFVDVDGTKIDVTVRQSLDFTGLGYTYEDFPEPRAFLRAAGIADIQGSGGPLLEAFTTPPLPPAAPEVLGGLADARIFKSGQTNEIDVPVSGLAAATTEMQPRRQAVLPMMMQTAGEGSTGAVDADAPIDPDVLRGFGAVVKSRKRIYGEFSGITTDLRRPIIVNVFVNCPYLTPKTPYTDPHYAGSFAFFHVHGGPEGHDGHADGGGEHNQTFVVELTGALENVDIASVEKLKVQLVAAGGAEDGEFTVARTNIIAR